MLGPQAWLERQRERKQKEREAREDAQRSWSRPRFEGYNVVRNARTVENEKRSKEFEVQAKVAMRNPGFRGGWERKSFFFPVVKNKAKTDASEQASRANLAKPSRMSRISGMWGIGSRIRRQQEEERAAKKKAQEAMRAPRFQGGWERKSLFHRIAKQKEEDRKAHEFTKQLHSRSTIAGSVTSAISSARSSIRSSVRRSIRVPVKEQPIFNEIAVSHDSQSEEAISEVVDEDESEKIKQQEPEEEKSQGSEEEKESDDEVSNSNNDDDHDDEKDKDQRHASQERAGFSDSIENLRSYLNGLFSPK